MRTTLSHWTVDYGSERKPENVLLPHAWRQELPLDFEGPVVYRTTTRVGAEPTSLLFHGVSHEAQVSVNGQPLTAHCGTWDAFAVPLTGLANQDIEICVAVTKSGGNRFPVKSVAGGFLPYVFNTFGGIYKPVELVLDSEIELNPPPKPPPVIVNGARIELDGQPFYMRGLLHWGWYPELGHQNPPEDAILEEIAAATKLGFNLVKFCLWLPPHRYLEILREQGMQAWIELPFWQPHDDPTVCGALGDELLRIVREYAHHPNVVAWTASCELAGAESRAVAAKVARFIRAYTGCPLVKDSSGGSEMYGTDSTEFGTFYDFHPYCEPQFYPQMLDSLLPGARILQPTLLGEFNDADVHRDLARIGDELPFWASNLPELNDKGVRWQYDLPKVVSGSRFSNEPTASHHRALMESSRSQALFMRKFAAEAVRARSGFGGYVVTGWRDTPISSSGMFDDWGEPRFTAEECRTWNSPHCLFLIPARAPNWVHGGNRPGWADPFNHFLGPIHWRVGLGSETGLQAGLTWEIGSEDGNLLAWGSCDPVCAPPLESLEVGEIVWKPPQPGSYVLHVRFAGVANSWPIWVVPPQTQDLSSDLLQLTDEGALPKPFWREAAYEFLGDPFWAAVPFANRWERLLPICGDSVLDAPWLKEKYGADVEPLMNRIDVRTYEEAPILARVGKQILTTLRPSGGLGVQPNPAGHEFLRAVLRALH